MLQLPKKSIYIAGSRGTCIVKDQAGRPVVTEMQILAALRWTCRGETEANRVSTCVEKPDSMRSNCQQFTRDFSGKHFHLKQSTVRP